MTPRDICVVIPTLNEAAGIAAAIRSANGAGQIIVVDGGSADGTLEIAQAFEHVISLVSKPSRGGQLSVGAARCQLKVVLFLHADCRLCPGALEHVANSVASGHEWGALRQRIEAAGIQYRLLELGNAARVKLRGIPFGDQAMFVLAERLRQVGGIEAIPLMEDLRLARRLRCYSWPALTTASVMVSARRWSKRGVARQTVRNWLIQALHATGMAPEKLAKLYR